MKLTVIGCGDAFGSGGRFNTCFMLAHSNYQVLVDCGASSLLRMKQLGISPEAIDAVVITHFHGDHYGGIPFLVISNRLEYQRTRPLYIYGPPGVKEKVENLQEALYPGTVGLLSEINVQIVEYASGFQEILPEMWVRGVPVTHAPPSNPHGIQLQFGTKRFGFSGDSQWDERLIELADETDLFILECNNLKKDSPGHIGLETVMEKATLLHTKRLMLTHMGTEMLDLSTAPVERLEDGMSIDF